MSYDVSINKELLRMAHFHKVLVLLKKKRKVSFSIDAARTFKLNMAPIKNNICNNFNI